MKTTFFARILIPVLLSFLIVSCGVAPMNSPADVPIDIGNVLTGQGIPQDAKVSAIVDGNVIPIGLYETLRNVVQVATTMPPGTFIMQDPKTSNCLLAWANNVKMTWNFVGVTAEGSPVGNILKMTGNSANTMTFTDLIKYLEKEGWQYVTPAALPAGFTSALGTMQAFVAGYGTLLSSPFPILLVIPVGNMEELDPTYLGEQ